MNTILMEVAYNAPVQTNRRLLVPKLHRWIVFTLVLLLPILASGVRAQADIGIQFAAVQNGQITLFGLGDAPLVVNNPPNNGLFSIVWNADGNLLAYILNDESFQAHVMVVDVNVGVEPVMLDTGMLVSGFPISFAPDGQLIYVGQPENVVEPSVPYLADIKRIAPQGDAQPETLATVEFQLGCGGGASIPTYWRYWEESGFGGSPLTLRMTDYGVVYSTNCSGGGLALYNLETGVETKIGPEVAIDTTQQQDGPLGRIAYSPDGKTIAGVQAHFVGENPQKPFVYSLVLVDLSTLAVTDVATQAEPDQLAWNNDGTQLFYSSLAITGNLADGLSPEALDRLGQVTGRDQNGAILGVNSVQATIHQLNIAAGEDITLYTADAFAIGRMAATPEGQHLIASQVAGLNAWVAGIADGTYDPQADTDGSGARALVPVTLYRIPLITREAPIAIGENLSQFALRPSRQ
jgi:dipeptidyl aminopeptidase/acylaminoacyl peptidase